jgi:hypothetical protein
MSRIKLLSILFAGTLIGCGGESNDTDPKDTDPNSNDITITAIDGYLYNALLYKQSEDGVCLTTELLGTTDEGGQVSASITDLADGYCVVATSSTIDQDNPNAPIGSGFTIYSPAPRLLEQGENIVISPFTSYIQQSISDKLSESPAASEEEILATISSAKVKLADALGLDSSDQAVLNVLLSDYVDGKLNASSSELQEVSQKAHTFARLAIQIESQNSDVLEADEFINLAKITVDKLDDMSNDESSFDDVSSFMSGRKDSLIDDNSVYTLKNVVNNPVIMADMPYLNADPQQLLAIISQAITDNSGNFNSTVGLDLGVVNFTDIYIDNAEMGVDARIILSQTKVGATWSAEKLAITGNSDQNDDTASFVGNTLTPNTFALTQSGTFIYTLSVEKEIDGYTYPSNSISFELNVSNTEVPNSAPEYLGNMSNAVETVLEQLIDDATSSGAIFDPSEYGLEGPAEFSMNTGGIDLSSLFEDSDGDELTVSVAGNQSDFAEALGQAEYQCFGSYCIFGMKDTLPTEGEKSYRVSVRAEDALGAKSDLAFNFIISIDSEQNANVTLTTDSSTGPNNGNSYNEDFNAVFITPTRATLIKNTLLEKLGVEYDNTNNVSAEQMFEVRSYRCTDDNKCQQGTTGNFIAVTSLSTNSYFTLADDGTLTATGVEVSGTETIKLTATYDSQPIKIYESDNDYNLNVDIDTYGEYFEFIIEAGPTVTVTIKK